MKKIIGVFLVFVVFAIIIGMCIVTMGLKDALVTWGIAVLLTVILVTGIMLITQ